jgi:hypothetical protein
MDMSAPSRHGAGFWWWWAGKTGKARASFLKKRSKKLLRLALARDQPRREPRALQ